ncbi:MAG: YwaF family protein [Lachnospiraceae bacterium]|nr:YwaF family protein [Lachnospiraceae bacterium]
MLISSSFWTFRPFNLIFWLTTLFFAALLIVATLLLRNKSPKTKKLVILISCLVTIVGFFAYKYALSIDQEYNVLIAARGGFNWWGELPLHLCNINMILIPIAIYSERRALQCFCFFIGPLGAAMAILMPSQGFSDVPLFLPRMLGYFGTHYMIVIEALAIGTFGLYRPKWADLPKAIAAFFITARIIFGIIMLIRAAGLNPHANYFYTAETEGNPLLEIFHRWIPAPFLYLIPSYVILLPYMLLVVAPFELALRARGKKEAKAADREKSGIGSTTNQEA